MSQRDSLDTANTLAYLLDRYGLGIPIVSGVKQFFAGAAKDGDAVICWLD
ncbi:hypothetical protein [Catellatospora methionotrophica]